MFPSVYAGGNLLELFPSVLPGIHFTGIYSTSNWFLSCDDRKGFYGRLPILPLHIDVPLRFRECWVAEGPIYQILCMPQKGAK